MDAPNWDRVKHVFQEALDSPPDARMARARELCGDDRALLAEVESLLATHQQAGDFAEQPAVELLRALPSEATLLTAVAPGRGVRAGDRLGAYEIHSLIGAGGMGDVYKACDTRLDRTVAIKVMRAHTGGDSRARERFEREARAVAALSHPHICTLHDVGHRDGVDFLVMEHLAGDTLASRLATGPLSPPQALEIAIQIAAALDSAHRAGIVHRDLKPGNVFLVKDRASASPTAKLLDFGLAKASAQPTGATTGSPMPASELTVPGALLGTVQYMAPEQLEGTAADARTDIFALGLVLYEMITGRKAFEGASQASLIAAILAREPPPLSSLQPLTPPAVDRIVRTCLAKHPDDRFQTARDLLRQLTWARDDDSGAAGVNAARPVAIRRSMRPHVVWAVVATIATMTATASVALLYSRRQVPAAASSISFSIDPPPGTRFPRGTADMAVSPDGTRLVFVALSVDGTRRLWVRRFDSVSARPLDGSENGYYPFWSPDGRSIGFFASGKLRRIDEAGGSVQVLCDAPFVRGGTWNRDGTILIGGSSGGIQRLADTGGAVTQVTTLDASRKEHSHVWPVFLPDGRRFLYLARSEIREQTGIYQGTLDSSQTQRVLAAISNVSPAGNYLFTLNSHSLVAHAYDADRARVAGEPVTIADQISLDNPERSGSAFASSAGVLAYRSASPDSRLVEFDRDGREVGSFPTAADYQNPALAPDGVRTAIEKTDVASGKHTIWIVELARGVTSRLLFDAFGAHGPVWSPDGSRVAFASNRLGGIDMYSTRTDGVGGEELLLASSAKQSLIPTDWSLDGRYLLYILGQTPGDLWILPMSPREKPHPFLASPSNELQGKFSPDVRWIAYTSDESGAPEVYVRRFPGGDGKWRVSTHGGTQPRWRHDGKEIFYLALDGRLMAAAVTSESSTFETGAPRTLFDTGITTGFLDHDLYVVSRDGQRILVNVSAEEKNPSPITVVVNWDAKLKK